MTQIKIPLKARYRSQSVGTIDAIFLNLDHSKWIHQLLETQKGNQSNLQFNLMEISGVQGYFVWGLKDYQPDNSISPIYSFTQTGNGFFHPNFSTIVPNIGIVKLREFEEPRFFFVWDPKWNRWIRTSIDDSVSALHFIRDCQPSVPADEKTQVGIYFPDQIESLHGLQELDINLQLEEARGDIGRNAKDLSSLSSAKNANPRLNNTRFRSNPFKFITAFATYSITKHLPEGGSPDSFASRLHNWAASQFASQEMVDQDKRNSEIEKLIHLFGKNPDEALKFAIPMNDDSHWRPEGFSGNQLVRRGMGSLFGGLGSGFDPWVIHQKHQQALFKNYQEAAQRAVQQKRFQQAAYIYCRLLGDYHAAASVLAKGGLFREAAALYQQKLKDDISAANCLMKGGFYEEASQIFLSKENWKEAALCYEKLGWHQKRTEALRTHIGKLTQEGKYIQAATVLYEDLEEKEEAKNLLLDCWPEHHSSELAVSTFFQWNAADGNHDRSRQFIENSSSILPSTPHAAKFLKVLVQQSAHYPDLSVRELCQQQAQKTAGIGLKNGNNSEQRTLINTYRQLFPSDPIFGSDCYRAAKRRYAPKTSPKRKSSTNTKNKTIDELAAIQLPNEQISWKFITPIGPKLLCLGSSGGKFHTCCLSIEQEEAFGLRQHRSGFHGLRPNDPLLVAKVTNNPFQIVCHPLGYENVDSNGVSFGGIHFGYRWAANFQPILSPNIIGLCGSNEGLVLCLYNSGNFLFRLYDSQQNILETVSFNEDSERVVMAGDLPVPILRRDGKTYAGIGNTLYQIESSGITGRIEFGQPIRKIASSSSGTRFRLAVGFNDRIEVIWDEFQYTKSNVRIVDAEAAAELLFTKSGKICFGKTSCRVFHCDGRQLSLNGTITSDSEIEMMFPCERKDMFGLLTRNGLCRVFRVP